MAPTIHQRLMGYVVNWATGPGWVRDGSEIAKLRADGMRVLKVQLVDNGPIPVEQAQEWRDAGVRVWGMVWVKDDVTPEWLKAERVRLGLAGLDLNCEEPVRALDADSSGQWSANFCNRLRALCPTLPMHFDSYFGSAAGGINLGAYKAASCRFSIQTFWGPPATNVWDDPPTNIVKWCAGAQPVIPKAIVKPILQAAPRDDGTLPDYDVAIADWQASGCKGGALYPIDSFPDFDELRALVRKMIAAGVAY